MKVPFAQVLGAQEVPLALGTALQAPLAHIVERHTVLGGQAAPQLPQLAGFVRVSTQMPLHRVWPLGHELVHIPLTQDEPEGQTLPQLPQLVTSVAVVTHRPPQHVWPPGQGPSLTTPSQLLSSPLHTSGCGVCWPTQAPH